MAIRSNHYDAAFEQYLRRLRVPYVAVDEQRRALAADASLKSFDFIVARPDGRREGERGSWLVDVKGRRFPTGGPGGGRWENWVTAEDVECLLKWETVFGGGSRAVLVFAYDLAEGETAGCEAPFVWGGRRYAFFAVTAADYATAMTSRSESWATVNLPRADFDRLRVPFAELL
ncbi:HYExAFE family protein [Alienimonas sp. DA493]|uniref:HYExAFE family protein n=1 Tax=Alienimonas sp. DA493 TaxID=3373605 RepID=UPI00375494C0